MILHHDNDSAVFSKRFSVFGLPRAEQQLFDFRGLRT
jgi:hypothetical protein